MLKPSFPTVRFLIVAALAALAAGCGNETQNRTQQPVLLASIAPVAMIAREVAAGDVEVRELIRGGDPHHYAPKVADRLAMESAQLVVWLGPEMESVLARQMSLLPAGRQLGLLAAGGYEFEGADADDPHLWLRPRNAAVMAAHIANRLAQLNPQRAEAFRTRARDFSRAMANLQKVQDRALWAYRDVPIVSTHKAYSQFFGPAGVVTDSLGTAAGHQHGARTMLDKQKKRGEGPVRGCLFGEVPRNDRDQQTAVHLNLDYVALDPLGTALPGNADYADLMARLLADARQCLGAIPDGDH
ncbi:zinc ABC transporter substrate-binding protein [Microbulbifer salipaludis]|uniref:High-affinity zinc uptake system protein ZnuA n=1 Tax=Microbulbifer salipaludis TaxID=187980 RepID=A0ABS3E2H1_9GAMM|nr:metal ABC transporter substrate-binding protein [Microbulbifer salipaludis]MBN8429499.1 zinc ABC transporter substrate-binding protein [Microbulbifer salipaludis]